VCVCVCVCEFQLLNPSTNFYETCYGQDTIQSHRNSVLSNFLQGVITAWRQSELIYCV